MLLGADDLDVLQCEAFLDYLFNRGRRLRRFRLGLRVGPRMRFKVLFQCNAGVRFLLLGDRLGGTLAKDLAATAAPFRSHVDDPIGGLNEVEVVLDYDHRVAEFD